MLQGQGYLPVTDVVNSQLVPITPYAAIGPAAYGPAPIQHDFYSAQPTTPPFAGGGGAGAGLAGGDTCNNTLAQLAEANPLHPRYSPVLWAVAGVLIAAIGLRVIHWG